MGGNPDVMANGNVTLHRLLLTILVDVMSVGGVKTDIPSIHVVITDGNFRSTIEIAIAITTEVPAYLHFTLANDNPRTPGHLYKLAYYQPRTGFDGYQALAVRLSCCTLESKDKHTVP